MWLLCLAAAAASSAAAAEAAEASHSPQGFERIEAARAADWNTAVPPAAGWTAVTLPDNWSQRWPGFSGVVWYRLRWNEPADAAALRPAALMLEYLNMAGAVYLNGSLVARDANLTEPLSRSWNVPRRWLLDAPLLRPGRNELLVRVSGLAAYQPGLGPASVGEPAQIAAAYDNAILMRHTLQLLGTGLTLAMGMTYGILWLFRRSETVYGWFSLFSIFWLPYSYNYIATGTWPFGSTDTYQNVNIAELLASVACFFMFASHFSATRRAWLRRAVGWVTGLCAATTLLAPPSVALPLHTAMVQLSLAVVVWGSALICRHAWISRKADAIAVAFCVLIPVVAGTHDVLMFSQVLSGNRYYTPLSSSAMLVGISFALTLRLVTGLRLVENFNRELRQRVDEATGQLSAVLTRQHAVELERTRMNGRMSLVRDLHDGLGMTLSGHIHSLENDNVDAPNNTAALWTLREIRDDLRLIIESSSLDDDSGCLSERLIPLRHRTTRMLDAIGIECRWELIALDYCRLDERRSLDFLRLLQEALANVLKHSRASEVRIRIEAAGSELALSVQDNGQGFDPRGVFASGSTGTHMGVSNMHARARRLGGVLDIQSGASGTELLLRCPVDSALHDLEAEELVARGAEPPPAVPA